MPQESPGAKQSVTVRLPELLAKRLQLAMTRMNRSAEEVILEILSNNLPRLEDPKKRAPYF